jgi:hypothetical protein
VATLAEKTGWHEEYIKQIPFYKILSYFHVYNVRSGARTDWRHADAASPHMSRQHFASLFDK